MFLAMLWQQIHLNHPVHFANRLTWHPVAHPWEGEAWRAAPLVVSISNSNEVQWQRFEAHVASIQGAGHV
jgi:hypothetical protein